MNTIQEKWEFFEKMCMPPEAPELQRREMRRAFYAGASAYFAINIAVCEMSDEAALQIINGCEEEMQQFAKMVVVGDA